MSSNSGDQSNVLGALIHRWNVRQRRSQIVAAQQALSINVNDEAQVADLSQVSRLVGIPIERTTSEPQIVLPEVLIQAALVIGDKEHEGLLVQGVSIAWFEIIKELSRDSDFLFKVSPRKMEELIAGAYEREGWPEVVLTPHSGDQGRDVIASRSGVGAIRIFDQVKAYQRGYKVPADDVRALLGVLALDQNVSKGVITTTSSFAPGAHAEFRKVMPYRLELKEGPVLIDWLKGLLGSP